MKKIGLILVLLLALSLLFACGGETTTASTTDGTPTTDGTENPLLPEGERVVKNSYTAVLNDVEWNPTNVNTDGYDLFGTGSEIYSKVNTTYGKEYALTYIVTENGEETTYSAAKIFSALKGLGVCGAKVETNETAKTAVIRVFPSECQVLSSWKAVTAQAGAYIRFEFTASLPLSFAVTVTAVEGGSATTSLYTQEGIEVKGEGSTYRGMGQATVPFAAGRTYYINICLDDSAKTVMASFPLNATQSKYDTSRYQLVFREDWTYVNDEQYMEMFAFHFYTVYPRLHARWGMKGNEPTLVYLDADRTYEGVAAASGTRVFYSVDNLNGGSPEKCGGALSHELTHLVQKHNLTKTWLNECWANYGRHRYWSYAYDISCVEQKTIKNAIAWNYSKYGDSQLLFSWMDWCWPTLDKNNDGKATPDEYGLIDYIAYSAKFYEGPAADDDPYTEGTPFNNWVKEKTGFATFDLMRQEFVRQAESGAWTFKGFRDYKDNFVTENLPGLANTEFIMHEAIVPTAKTNPLLDAAMTTGDNLCLGATIKRVAQTGTSGNPAENLIDGDLTNRYQAKRAGNLYGLTGVANEIVIDLGETKTFDTYTLVCYASQTSFIAKSWEILVSEDGVSFTGVDYQKDNAKVAVSVSFDEVTARYVKIRLFEPDSQAGVTRLSEFMLFDQAS